MQSVPNSPLIMHATASSSGIFASPPAVNQPKKTQRPLVVTAKQTHDQSAPVQPPAKKTNPDANDAAARSLRACPRPVGYVVQLLLVALYMSTYDELVFPSYITVSNHLTLPLMHALTTSATICESPPAVNQPQQHKHRLS
jgi:hypothetical protein